jgi:hypothetical protein
MSVELENIKEMIYLIRGQKVMFDIDLANLYRVETRALNQAVKRNIKRFPEDFMFRLSQDEYDNLKSQFVTSSVIGEESVSNHPFLQRMVLPCSHGF